MRRLLLIFLVASAGCGRGQTEYVLGAAGPWTEAFGEMNRRGMQMALDEINAGGGIRGVPLRIAFQDDRGDGSRASVIAQEFVDDPAVSAVVGHVTSSAMVAAAFVYDGKLAAVATTASAPALSGISRWSFRVIASDSASGAALARAASERGMTRVAILYENDSYGRGLARAFRDGFAGEVVAMEPIEGALANAEPYIAFLKLRRPDLVFVAGTEASGIVLLREARRQSLAIPFMGGDGWSGVVADPAAEGALVGTPFLADEDRPEVREFVARYRQAFGADPDANVALAYDATRLLARAIADVGADRARIRDWLAGLDARSAHAGVSGPIHFTPRGDPVGSTARVARVRAGRLVMESSQ